MSSYKTCASKEDVPKLSKWYSKNLPKADRDIFKQVNETATDIVFGMLGNAYVGSKLGQDDACNAFAMLTFMHEADVIVVLNLHVRKSMDLRIGSDYLINYLVEKHKEQCIRVTSNAVGISSDAWRQAGFSQSQLDAEEMVRDPRDVSTCAVAVKAAADNSAKMALVSSTVCTAASSMTNTEAILDASLYELSIGDHAVSLPADSKVRSKMPQAKKRRIASAKDPWLKQIVAMGGDELLRCWNDTRWQAIYRCVTIENEYQLSCIASVCRLMYWKEAVNGAAESGPCLKVNVGGHFPCKIEGYNCLGSEIIYDKVTPIQYQRVEKLYVNDELLQEGDTFRSAMAPEMLIGRAIAFYLDPSKSLYVIDTQWFERAHCPTVRCIYTSAKEEAFFDSVFKHRKESSDRCEFIMTTKRQYIPAFHVAGKVDMRLVLMGVALPMEGYFYRLAACRQRIHL